MLWGEQDGRDRGAKATLASDAVPASITLDGLQRKKKSTHSSDPGQGRARDGDGEVEPRRLHLSRKGALVDGATRQRIDMDLGGDLGPSWGTTLAATLTRSHLSDGRWVVPDGPLRSLSRQPAWDASGRWSWWW